MASGPFETVDPKLTIYALANGMDLVKEDADERLLTWYREGRERAIVLKAEPAGTLSLHAAAWQTNRPENRSQKKVDEVRPDDLVSRLSPVLDSVIETANSL